MVFQWAVQVSQRLQSRSWHSGAFRRFGGAVTACFDGYGDGLFSQTHRQHHIQNLELNLCYTLKKSLLSVRLLRHSMRAADVASTAWSTNLGRWPLVACFSNVKNHNVWGPHLFPSVTTHAKKPLCLPRTVIHRAKKSLCNRSQFRLFFLPHRFVAIPNFVLTTQIYQDSSFPSATRQHWISHNLSDSRIPQIWAKSKKLRKHANLTEKSRCSSGKP